MALPGILTAHPSFGNGQFFVCYVLRGLQLASEM